MPINHGERALALLAIALVAAAVAPITAQGEVFETPPALTPRWDFLVDSGVLLSLAWSPSGEYLAVVNNLYNGSTSSRILVLSRNGSLVWDSGDLGKGIGDIAWGPSGEIAAVPILGEGLIVAIPGNGTVRDLPLNNVRRVAWNMVRDLLIVQVGLTSARIVTPTGNVTLLIGVGKPIHDIGWSPDGKYFYIAADDGVMIFNIDSIRNDSHQLKIPGSAAVRWSSDSRFVAVASQKSASGYYKNITVVDLQTSKEWSISGVFFDLSFRPGTHELLVGGTNLTLYSEDGEALWETKITSPAVIVAWAYRVFWHPSGDNVTLVYGSDTLIVVDGDTGNIIWKNELGFEARYPAQDPKGEYLALIAGSRRVVAYGRPADLARVVIPGTGCPAECKVVFRGGGSVKTFKLVPGGNLTLYATPGNYTVVFGLNTFPKDWGPIIGNWVGWLLNKTVSEELVVEAAKHYVLEPPLERLRNEVLAGLGKILIEGPPGATVTLTWGTVGGTSTVEIPESGEVTVYAVPTTYGVGVALPSGKVFVLGNIMVEPNKTVTLDLTTLIPAETTTTTQAPPPQSTTTTTTTTAPPPTGTTQTTTTTTTQEGEGGETTTTASGGGGSTPLYAAIIAAVVIAAAAALLVARRR